MPTLEACGYNILPLVSQVVLPDGETDYTYSDGSLWRVPPPGFDPATATPQQLAQFGLSSLARPHATAARDSIKTFATPPPYLIDAPITLGTYQRVTAPYFSGYFMTGGGSNWDFSAADWVQPTDGYTACTDASVAFWTGLGGVGTGSNLAQNGTAQGYGWGGNAIWYEVLPGLAHSHIIGYTGPGNAVDVSTEYLGNDQFRFVWTVGGEGFGPITQTMLQTPTLGSADTVVERPDVGFGGAQNTPLLNFQSITMAGYGDFSGVEYPISGAPGYYQGTNMIGQSHGDTMATASAVESDGATFVDTHQNCA